MKSKRNLRQRIREPYILGLILLLMILTISLSCSSTTLAKRLEVRAFNQRTYRFCDPRETPDPIGKLCYRYCTWTFVGKCRKTMLIVEDLSDPEVFNRFRNAGFMISQPT